MPPHADADPLHDSPDPAEDDGSVDSAALDTEADVICIVLDPASGRAQEYVEDCQVCCRPWRVRLWYDATGAADVQLDPIE